MAYKPLNLAEELAKGHEWLHEQIQESIWGSPTWAKSVPGPKSKPAPARSSITIRISGSHSYKVGDTILFHGNNYEIVEINHRIGEITLKGCVRPAQPLTYTSQVTVLESVDEFKELYPEKEEKPKRNNLLRPYGEWKITA